MPTINFRALLPHLAAILIFILLIFAYFPELFSGKSLRMDDIEQHKGMSNELVDYRERTGEEAIWTNTMFSGMPGYLISVVFKGNLVANIATVIKMGFPRPADSMLVIMLGLYILFIVLKVRQPLAIVGAAAYCFTTYNLLIMEAGHMSKVDAISWIPWVIAGVLLVLNGKHILGGLFTAIFLSIQIKSSHFQITYYLAFIILFLVMFFLVDAFKNKTAPSLIRGIGVLVIAAIFGVLTNISSLYTIYDYGKDSIRGKSELTIGDSKDSGGLDKNYALDYSYGIGESFSYMIPNVYGGASNLGLAEQKEALKEADATYRQYLMQMPQYWSDTSTTGPFYAGALVCFLCVLGFFLVKSPVKWAFLASAILALLLGWGKNFESFSVFMLENFPGYNKFRAVKMTLVITDFVIPVMAILGLNEAMNYTDLFKEKRKELIAAFSLTGGLSLLFYLMPEMFFNFDYIMPQMEEQLNSFLQQAGLDKSQFIGNLSSVRIAIFKADALRAFLLISAGGAILFAYGKFKFNAVIMAAMVGVIVIGDLFSVDKRYVNKKDLVSNTKSAIPYEPSAADEAIFAMEVASDPSLQTKIDAGIAAATSRSKKKSGLTADEMFKYRYRALVANTNYRVLNLAKSTFNDAATSYFHKSIGGYSAAKLERYQEMIKYHIDPNMKNIFSAFNAQPTDSSLNEMMSKLYALNMLNMKYIIYNEKAPPLVNKSTLGNAWTVQNIKWVNSADEEIKAMDANFNAKNTAIVDKRFKDVVRNATPSLDSTATIILKNYAPNALIYDFNATQNQVVLFSEVYYEKGWKAFIDEKETPHFRSNYIIRGLVVPAGKHEIKFIFHPDIYYSTEKISYASSIILLIGFLLFVGFSFKKKKSEVAK
jgi:hypothetical protein